MEKDLVIVKISGLLNKKLENLKESLRQAEDSVKQAPTFMESASDTSRFQFNQLVNNLRILVKDYEKAIEKISESRIIKVEKDKEIFYFLLSPISLGEPLKIGSDEFRVVSFNAPIAKSLENKKEGEKIEIKTPLDSYTIKILEIYA